MKLVLIHGRDQQGKDPKQLEATWMKTWGEGLKLNGLICPVDQVVVFPFYGDELDKLVKQAQLPDTTEKVISRGDAQSGDLDFFNDVLTDIAKNAAITEPDIIKNFPGDVRERGPLNWGWVQAILKTLDKTALGGLSLEKFTYDAYMYLTIPAIQRKINALVAGLIGNEPCVVVSHSLGSVVGYNVLKNNPGFSVKKYITIGSPLGLRSFKAKLDKPIEMPTCITGDWLNAYDEADVVALQPLNKSHFNIDPEIENYANVKNRTDNRHGIEGYLNDPVVAKKIFEALTTK